MGWTTPWKTWLDSPSGLATSGERCQNGKKATMSFPPTPPSCTAGHQGGRQGSASAPRSNSCHPLPMEGEHQLEKLQFALAIALTRGDALRSSQLREEIAKLGENREEPGT